MPNLPPPSLPPGVKRNTLGVLSWTGLEQVESSEPWLSRGRSASWTRGQGAGEWGGQAGTRFCLHRLGTLFCSGFESSGCSWAGELPTPCPPGWTGLRAHSMHSGKPGRSLWSSGPNHGNSDSQEVSVRRGRFPSAVR